MSTIKFNTAGFPDTARVNNYKYSYIVKPREFSKLSRGFSKAAMHISDMLINLTYGCHVPDVYYSLSDLERDTGLSRSNVVRGIEEISGCFAREKAAHPHTRQITNHFVSLMSMSLEMDEARRKSFPFLYGESYPQGHNAKPTFPQSSIESIPAVVPIQHQEVVPIRNHDYINNNIYINSSSKSYPQEEIQTPINETAPTPEVEVNFQAEFLQELGIPEPVLAEKKPPEVVIARLREQFQLSTSALERLRPEMLRGVHQKVFISQHELERLGFKYGMTEAVKTGEMLDLWIARSPDELDRVKSGIYGAATIEAFIKINQKKSNTTTKDNTAPPRPKNAPYNAWASKPHASRKNR